MDRYKVFSFLSSSIIRVQNLSLVPQNGFRDVAMKVMIPFSLGLAKPTSQNPYGSLSSFGMAGSGGSFGFADPQNKIGYGYVLNGMGTHLTDPRELVLRTAMYDSIGISDPYHN